MFIMFHVVSPLLYCKKVVYDLFFTTFILLLCVKQYINGFVTSLFGVSLCETKKILTSYLRKHGSPRCFFFSLLLHLLSLFLPISIVILPAVMGGLPLQSVIIWRL